VFEGAKASFEEFRIALRRIDGGAMTGDPQDDAGDDQEQERVVGPRGGNAEQERPAPPRDRVKQPSRGRRVTRWGRRMTRWGRRAPHRRCPDLPLLDRHPSVAAQAV